MRVSVVGGGVAGLSLAVELARRGHGVTVYEQEHPGYGATGKSSGLIVTIFEENLIGLVLDSLKFYYTLPGSAEMVRGRDALYLNRSGACVSRLLRIHASTPLLERGGGWPELGVEFEYGRDYYAVIKTYLTDAGWVVNTLYSELHRMGGRILEGPVERRGEGFYYGGVRVEEPVVVAAGPWTPILLPEVEGSVAVYRCQAACVEGPSPQLIVEDDALEYYLVPVTESRFIIGDGSCQIVGDPWEAYNPDPEESYVVLERYARRVPEAWESRVIRMWSAPCIVGGDGLPLAGRVYGDVYVLTGFDGAGLSIAPGVARLLADELEGRGRVPPEYSRLDRPAVGVVEPYTLTC